MDDSKNENFNRNAQSCNDDYNTLQCNKELECPNGHIRDNQEITPSQHLKEKNNMNMELKELVDNCDPNKIIDIKVTTIIDEEVEKQQLFDTKPKLDEEKMPYLGVNSEGHNDIDIENDNSSQPLSERWSPVGANYEDALTPSSELLTSESTIELLSHSDYQEKLSSEDMTRLKSLEEEQEFLTTSLLALTSHFAHVQLRVRQIVEAPQQERDQLLKDLDEYAFRGIPETSVITTAPRHSHNSPALSTVNPNVNTESDDINGDGKTLTSTINTSHQRQFELIEHLKSQLNDLEKFAYESGAPVLPQHMLLEKQKIIIDELKQRLNFRVDEQNLPELTTEELKNHVDTALGEFVGPFKMKEQLVAQLKTQITDLERFIAFLQCDTDESKLKTLTSDEKTLQAYNSYAVKSKRHQSTANANASTTKTESIISNKNNNNNEDRITKAVDESNVKNIELKQVKMNSESLHSKAHGLMDKASILMQIFASTHFGGKTEQFQKNTLKRTCKGNHWGDLRAQLEMDIQEVSSLVATLNFDREKLAQMKKLIKTSKLIAHKGYNKQGQFRSYRHLSSSSDSDDAELTKYVDDHNNVNDDNELKSYDIINMQNRRLVQCAHYHGDSINTLSSELTSAVRKNFAMTLMRLMQHGLRMHTETMVSTLILPFMRCLNPSQQFDTDLQQNRQQQYSQSKPYYYHSDGHSILRNDDMTRNVTDVNNENIENDDTDGGGLLFGNANSCPMHAWELILEYYYLKHGDDYNNTPARKLSQSFNLDIVDSQAVTPKQTLLSAIGAIIAMHRPYKRSYNAHFKAFVCAGLNNHQLVDWLHLIFNCTNLVETYYLPSSYAACTAFRDALRSIDTLTKYDFDLPVDLAIRHFRNL